MAPSDFLLHRTWEYTSRKSKQSVDMSFIDLMPERGPSRMMAREVVLHAKAMLSVMPEVVRLTREGFITICVESTLAFLREGKSGCDDRSGSNNSDCAEKPRMNSSVRVVTRSLHRNSRSRSGAAQGRRQRPRCVSDTPLDVSKREKQSLVPQLTKSDLAQLKRLVLHNYLSWCRDDDAQLKNVDSVRFPDIPRAKIEAATIIKGVLDAPYRRGVLSRQRYSVIVLAVLEKLFPDCATLLNDAGIGHDCETHDRSENRSNSIEDNLMSGEMLMVNPPQDPQAPLRYDVAELAERLANRALEYFTDPDTAVNMEVPINEVKENHPVFVDGASPLPRKPHNGSVTNPNDAVSKERLTSLSSHSVQFDDAFEQQVERLCYVLEEKYALDLSGARASARRMGKKKADDFCRSVAEASTATSSAHSSPGGESVSGDKTNESVDAKQKRDRLYAEVLRCQSEMYQTQERLGSVVQELHAMEQAKEEFSG